MTASGSISFGPECDPYAIVDGVPLVELTRMKVGNCIVCAAEPSDTGMLENVRIERGVLVGDSYCAACAVERIASEQ